MRVPRPQVPIVIESEDPSSAPPPTLDSGEAGRATTAPAGMPRRKFVARGLAVATAGTLFRPSVSFAAPSELSPIGGGEPTPTDLRNVFSRMSTEVAYLQNVAQETLNLALSGRPSGQAGLTQEQIEKLTTLVQDCIELRSRLAVFDAAFTALPVFQQISLVIGTASLINRIGNGLDVLNDKVGEWDASVGGIPAGGVVDGAANGMDTCNNAVRDMRDDWNGKIPLTGTVILGPVQAVGEVLESSLRFVGLAFD